MCWACLLVETIEHRSGVGMVHGVALVTAVGSALGLLGWLDLRRHSCIVQGQNAVHHCSHALGCRCTHCSFMPCAEDLLLSVWTPIPRVA